jgi:hypothetical protein
MAKMWLALLAWHCPYFPFDHVRFGLAGCRLQYLNYAGLIRAKQMCMTVYKAIFLLIIVYLRRTCMCVCVVLATSTCNSRNRLNPFFAGYGT